MTDPVLGLAIVVLIVFAAFCLWAAIKLRNALRMMGEILARGSTIPEPPHPADGEFRDWDKTDKDPR